MYPPLSTREGHIPEVIDCEAPIHIPKFGYGDDGLDHASLIARPTNPS